MQIKKKNQYKRFSLNNREYVHHNANILLITIIT